MIVNKSLVASFFLAAGMFLYSGASADTRPGDIVILFDQSASMKKYNPKLVSKLWVLTFINTFKKPYNVVLVGFDDKVYEHMSISTDNEKDLKAFKKKVERIRASGLTTDFEAPLRYLVEYDKEVFFAVIITDGEPEIWDEKRWYLSKRIRLNERYGDLNRQYRELKSQGLTKAELYKRLNTPYSERNLELIDERLEQLKQKFGNKLIFLDILGKYEYLKRWSQTAGAELIVASSQSGRSPAAELRAAFSALQKKASEVIEEPLPEDFEQKIELAPQPPKAPEPEIKAEPQPKPSPKKPVSDTTGKASDQKRTIWTAPAAIIALLLTIALVFAMYNRDVKEARLKVVEEAPPAEETPSFDLLDESLYIDSVRKKFGSIVTTSLEAARKYIDKEIERAEEEGDEAKLRLLREEKLKYDFSKRVALRILVAPGAMDVLWTDEIGESHRARVIDISLNGVLFDAPGFGASRIDTIECLAMNETFHIKRSRVMRRGESLIVAVLEEFADNVSDRMKWIEILTRIEEAS